MAQWLEHWSFTGATQVRFSAKAQVSHFAIILQKLSSKGVDQFEWIYSVWSAPFLLAYNIIRYSNNVTHLKSNIISEKASVELLPSICW